MKRPFSLLVPSLLFAVFSFAATPSGVVTVTFPKPERPTVDTTVRLFAEIRNTSASVDATDLQLDIEVRGGPYVGGESTDRWSCANHQNPYTLRCKAALLRAGESLPLQVYIGPATEGNFEVRGFILWKVGEEEYANFPLPQSARFPRALRVTNANDAGDGSLRAAVEHLNGPCTKLPCDVSFEVAEAIVLNSPLPPIVAHDFRIEGPATIDGSGLAAGHGLELRGAGPFVVNNLTIRRFPWEGMYVARYSSVPDVSFVTNNTLDGNGSRGLAIEGGGNLRVAGNTITGSGRSGIFLTSGYNVDVVENRLEDNGASGIYVGPGGNYVRVDRNRIARNVHFGAAVDRRAQHVTLTDNSITANGILGIDRGLDGFNGYDFDDYDTGNARIPPPRLHSATYDPATNATTITGRHIANDNFGTWVVTLYRNDVPGPHGDVVLGHASMAEGSAFSITVAGDLRGSFITAHANRYLNLGWSGSYSWTSEFSDHVEVR